jgi:hypothetical protein
MASRREREQVLRRTLEKIYPACVRRRALFLPYMDARDNQYGYRRSSLDCLDKEQ